MRICITTTGPDLKSLVDPRFGRCQYFLIVDQKGKLEKAIPNPGAGAFRGAGIQAAQTVAGERIEILITGNIGPNAFSLLQTTGLQIFSAPAGIPASQAFEMWQENKLSEIKAPLGPPSGPPGFGRGPGRGRGRGDIGFGRSW
jgi:predicted Fe-Mo cluster-binding NifX family protein